MDSPRKLTFSGPFGSASSFKGHRKYTSLTTDDLCIPASETSQSLRRAKSTIERTRPWTPLRSLTPLGTRTPGHRPQTPQTPLASLTPNRSLPSQSLQPQNPTLSSPIRAKRAARERPRSNLPPWDRTIDVVYHKYRQGEPKGSLEAAFGSCLITFLVEHNRAMLDSSTLRLPSHIRFRILQHLIADHSPAENPISLNPYGFDRECWEAGDFTPLGDALEPLWPYIEVSFGFYADVMLTFLSEHTFHATFSPFVNERLNPLATKWLNKYGPYMQSIAIEVDLSRLCNGPELTAINLSYSHDRIEELLFNFSTSQEKRPTSAPLDSLILLCRRFYGRRQCIDMDRESLACDGSSSGSGSQRITRFGFHSISSASTKSPKSLKSMLNKIYHVFDEADPICSQGSISSSGSSKSSNSSRHSDPFVEAQVSSSSSQKTADEDEQLEEDSFAKGDESTPIVESTDLSSTNIDYDDIVEGTDIIHDNSDNSGNKTQGSVDNDEYRKETPSDEDTQQIANSQIDASSINDIAYPHIDSADANTSQNSKESNGSNASANTDISILISQEDPESLGITDNSHDLENSITSEKLGSENDSRTSDSLSSLIGLDASIASGSSGNTEDANLHDESYSSGSFETYSGSGGSNSNSSNDENKSSYSSSGSGSGSDNPISLTSDALRNVTYGPSYCDEISLSICNHLIRLRNRVNSVRMAGFSNGYTSNFIATLFPSTVDDGDEQVLKLHSYRVAPSTAWPRLGAQKSRIDVPGKDFMLDNHDLNDEIPTLFPEGAIQLPPPVVYLDGTITLPNMGPLPPRRTRIRPASIQSSISSNSSKNSWRTESALSTYRSDSDGSSLLSPLFKVQSQDRSVMQMMMHKYGKGRNLSMRGYAHKMSSSI